jgi:hypothetical protein
MAMYIVLYRHQPGADNRASSWKNVNKEFNFDNTRYNFDDEFFREVLNQDHQLVTSDDYPPDYFVRPANILAIQKWIKETVPEGNRPRLLDLLITLSDNPDVYLAHQ